MIDFRASTLQHIHAEKAPCSPAPPPGRTCGSTTRSLMASSPRGQTKPISIRANPTTTTPKAVPTHHVARQPTRLRGLRGCSATCGRWCGLGRMLRVPNHDPNHDKMLERETWAERDARRSMHGIPAVDIGDCSTGCGDGRRITRQSASWTMGQRCDMHKSLYTHHCAWPVDKSAI